MSTYLDRTTHAHIHRETQTSKRIRVEQQQMKHKKNVHLWILNKMYQQTSCIHRRHVGEPGWGQRGRGAVATKPE